MLCFGSLVVEQVHVLLSSGVRLHNCLSCRLEYLGGPRAPNLYEESSSLLVSYILAVVLSLVLVLVKLWLFRFHFSFGAYFLLRHTGIR